MTPPLLVAAGGALGGLARWGLLTLSDRMLVVLGINVVGAFLLGLLLARRPSWRDFAGTGVLGGFTTMSAVAVQAVDASVPVAIAYLAGTLALGLGAAELGSRA